MTVTRRIETITPEIALAYLQKLPNGEIRGQSPNTVANLVAEMRVGEFHVELSVTDTIMFDEAGNLVNGTHRLRAALEAQVPFRCHVVRGIDYQPRKGHLYLAGQLKAAILEPRCTLRCRTPNFTIS